MSRAVTVCCSRDGERWAAELGKGLHGHGIEVTTWVQNGDETPDVTPANGDVVVFVVTKMLLRASQLAGWLAPLRRDVAVLCVLVEDVELVSSWLADERIVNGREAPLATTDVARRMRTCDELAALVQADVPGGPAGDLRVFICHADEDKPAVRDLCLRLTKLGFRPWLDEEALGPGTEWNDEIERAIRDSDVVLVCLSRGSVAKIGFVQKEIDIAIDQARYVPARETVYLVPVRLEKCEVPWRLRKWQRVDLFSERGEERLVELLRSKRAWRADRGRGGAYGARVR